MAGKGQNKGKKEQAPATEQTAAPVADKAAAPKAEKKPKKGKQQKA